MNVTRTPPPPSFARPDDLPPPDLAKDAAEQTIKEADQTLGKGLLNTQLEDDLLHHWVQGSGDTYTLPKANMDALEQTQDVQDAGKHIAANPGAVGDEIKLDGYHAEVAPVTLENGEKGYRVDMDFNTDQAGKGNEAFDGSLGKARVYFDEQGKMVGVHDTYDFSNDNFQVDGINAVGGSVGAKNFRVRGGVIEENPPPVPDGPNPLWAAGSLVGRAVEYAGDKAIDTAKDVGEAAVDTVQDAGEAVVTGAKEVWDWATG